MITKKKQLIIILFILICIGVFAFIIDYYKQTKVNFSFESKTCLDSLPRENLPFIISSNIDDIKLCLNKLISSEDINKLGLMRLNFSEYDYLVSFKKGVEKISYSKHYTSKHDFCPYIKEIPVELHYSKDSSSLCIYIYKLSEKNKFRHLCP
jgi:hypothetical protein